MQISHVMSITGNCKIWDSAKGSCWTPALDETVSVGNTNKWQVTSNMHITSCLQETAVEWTASHRQHFQLETTSASKQSNVLPSLTLQVIHLILHQRRNQQSQKITKKCHRRSRCIACWHQFEIHQQLWHERSQPQGIFRETVWTKEIETNPHGLGGSMDHLSPRCADCRVTS